MHYTLERDKQLNYKYFEIVPINVENGNGSEIIDGKTYTTIKLPDDAKYSG